MDFDTLKADSLKIGAEMYKWAIDLFPLNRSITGQGNRETLQYLKNILPNYATQIDALTNVNKLNLKKEDDMIQLIQQLK